MPPRQRDAPALRAHLVGLDGLRGLAALAVVADHTTQHLAGRTSGIAGYLLEVGAQGLSVFFVLSGFLIYRPFVVAMLDRVPMQPLRSYLRNRLLRILPAYWVVLLVSALLVGVVYLHGDQQFHPGASNIGRMTDPLTLAANLLLIQSYVPATMLTGIAPAWSLTTELTFYLVLPLLAAWAALPIRRRTPADVAVFAPAVLLLVVGGAMVALINGWQADLSAGALQWSAWGSSGSAVLERSLIAQAALFGLGMLVACLVERRRARAAGSSSGTSGSPCSWWRSASPLAA